MPFSMRRPFYGWWMVGISAVVFMIQNAAWSATFGAYLLEVQSEFGWSKFAISTAYSVSHVVSGLLSPAHGWLVDRLGSRFVLRVGSLMLGGGFVLLSIVETLWVFYGVVLLLGLGVNLAGFLTLQTSVASWFVRMRSRALALSSMGIGVGGLIAPAVTWSLVTHGWRATALYIGIAIIVTTLPLSAAFRNRPQDCGMLPDGDTSADAHRPLPKSVNKVSFTVGEALRDRSFWFVSAGHAVALVSVFAVMVHLVPLLVEGRGFRETPAQAMFAIVSISSLIGQLLGGFLGDRFSKTGIATLCMLGHCCGMTMMAFGDSPVIAVACVVHGLAWGVRGPLMSAIRADYYGMQNFATIMGYSSAIIMLGPLVGPSLAGALNDAAGNYTFAFALIGAMTGVSSLFFAFSRKPPLPARASLGATDGEPA